MADITARLADIKARIDELAGLAAVEHREHASRLAQTLVGDLEGLFEASPPAPRPAGPPPRAPRDEVERCPVCSLRSYRFQRGTIRESDYGGFEALYRCGSCAHEGWKEIT
jgi:hypothetical protein